ncbi:exoenzyme S [Aeromonas veronii]|nr:exoenzyme S [Aeromonas veronii]
MHDDCLLVMFRRQSRRGHQQGLSGLVAIFVLSAVRYLADRKPKKREPPTCTEPL